MFRSMLKSLAFCAALVIALARPAAAGELAVIVNADNPVSDMTAEKLKGFYLRRVGAWPNAEKVRPADLGTQDAARAAFLAKVLGMSSFDLERYWVEKQYASADKPPTKTPDQAGMVMFVKSFKGGLGFVDASAVAGDKGAGVRTILTLQY